MPTRPAARGAVPQPTKTPAETRRIIATLTTQHPNADTELNYRTPYELLVATILSAQCTDERVNQVTPALFKRYPDARALSRATTAELEPQIQSTGFFRAKSRSLVGMAQAVVQQHDGDVPKTMEELVKLPGVGRKTANVVLGHALGVPGLPVDRHVLRVANRIGIARSEDAEVVEQQLCKAMPPGDWTLTSDTLILHGRRICKPRPLCDQCVVRTQCDFYRTVLGAVGRSAKNRSPNGSSIEARRAPKARGAGEPERPARSRSESGSLIEARRAPKAPGAGEPERPAKSRSESESLIEARRAPKARGAGERERPAKSRAESGSLIEARRAPKARGTGRGGGAPRQIK